MRTERQNDGSIDERCASKGSADRKRYSFEQQATYIDNLEAWCKENYTGGVNARGAVAAYIKHKQLPDKFQQYFSKSKSTCKNAKTGKASIKTGWLFPAK